ncbi:hypothetical protein NQZ68_027600 [Dissostichus eleginoides]|nr:hypothetical protein NQZ68_027600 [Dissostichus eleginoides]
MEQQIMEDLAVLRTQTTVQTGQDGKRRSSVAFSYLIPTKDAESGRGTRLGVIVVYDLGLGGSEAVKTFCGYLLRLSDTYCFVGAETQKLESERQGLACRVKLVPRASF